LKNKYSVGIFEGESVGELVGESVGELVGGGPSSKK
jgi:hypothetical protein